MTILPVSERDAAHSLDVPFCAGTIRKEVHTLPNLSQKYEGRMSKPLFYYSEGLMGYDLGEDHPLKPRRLMLTVELLKSYGMFDTHLELVAPELADPDEVAQTHSRDYLEALFRMNDGTALPGMRKFGFGTGDNPIFRGIYELSLLYTGASIQAAAAIVEGAGGGQVAFNISGTASCPLCQSSGFLRSQ